MSISSSDAVLLPLFRSVKKPEHQPQSRRIQFKSQGCQQIVQLRTKSGSQLHIRLLLIIDWDQRESAAHPAENPVTGEKNEKEALGTGQSRHKNGDSLCSLNHRLNKVTLSNIMSFFFLLLGSAGNDPNLK